MSDPVVKPPSKADIDKAVAHLDSESNKAMTFAGKPGYNPYLFLTDKVAPLKLALTSGKEVTSELVAQALAIRGDEASCKVHVHVLEGTAAKVEATVLKPVA